MSNVRGKAFVCFLSLQSDMALKIILVIHSKFNDNFKSRITFGGTKVFLLGLFKRGNKLGTRDIGLENKG
jgi:hypothetical protein